MGEARAESTRWTLLFGPQLAEVVADERWKAINSTDGLEIIESTVVGARIARLRGNPAHISTRVAVRPGAVLISVGLPPWTRKKGAPGDIVTWRSDKREAWWASVSFAFLVEFEGAAL